MTKFKKLTFSIIFIICAFSIFIFLKNKATSEEIIKYATKIADVRNSDQYIMLRPTRVTGYFWEEVDMKGKHVRFCNIEGSDPFEELGTSYEFMISENTFIFFIEDVVHEYSETFGETMTIYTVDYKWDILYPVKHEDLIDNIVNKDYIISKDLA